MKKLHIFLLLIAFLAPAIKAQTLDSVDVIDYDITLDLSHGNPFQGDATVTLRLLRGCDSIGLELIGTVDSLWVNSSAIATPRLTAIPTTGIAVGDTFTVRVCYHSTGYVEDYGFGGMHFDNNQHYNLGVGFDTEPHSIGRAIMPCRDNFHDKATYTLRVHAKTGWTAECSGELVSRQPQNDGTELSEWRIAHPVPTYLVGISQAAWKRVDTTVANYPATYGYLSQKESKVRQVFEQLDAVVPMYEQCFGPYRWGRIGYIATNRGSMEHVNNIALAYQAMETMREEGQATIAHELGHAWFGNLITCTTEEDMWINEGGASFCSEVAMEAVSGRGNSDQYYQTNLENVIRTTHLTDNGYRALSGMPHDYTYGSTTYDKGWMVWHSLRGYLGDQLFYSSVRRLMDSKAFDNADANEVRDSLSLYSGVDLTDFFNFHVFSPGFIDYHVEANYNGNTAHVTVRQQSIGTDNSMRSNRVPVTFFSQSGQEYKHWIAFDGLDTSLTVELPFSHPAYCVLDYDKDLSDAAVIADLNASVSGLHKLDIAQIRINLAVPQADRARIAVEHHWGRPWDIDTVTGVIRAANRYWIVRGNQSYFDQAEGLFHYVGENYQGADYPHLDRDFFNDAASLDSIALLYRRNADSPWVALTRKRNSNTLNGHFVTECLQPGEYTLAVVDTNLMSIAETHLPSQNIQLFPNPVNQGASLTIEAPTDAPFSLKIIDAAGRTAWQHSRCCNGMSVQPNLAAGTYLVLIENKFVFLQSKLIVL